MRILLNEVDPTVAQPGQDLTDTQLAALYAYPEETVDKRPWVRANFVTTLDGAVAGSDGRSGSINTSADRIVFSLLRALSDVIIAGAGTVRTEKYRPARTASRWRAVRRAAQHPHPVIAVVSGSANLPPLLHEHRGDAGAVLLLTCHAADSAALRAARRALGDDHVLLLGTDRVDLRAALDALAERGLRRVLCEGGPRLLYNLVANDLIDELCLTLAPRIVAGDYVGLLSGTPVDRAFVPRMLVEADGTLAGRWFHETEVAA